MGSADSTSSWALARATARRSGLLLGLLRGRATEMRYYGSTFGGRLGGLRAGWMRSNTLLSDHYFRSR